MTSERQFISSYSSVWREVTPLSDGYWHVEKMLARRVSTAIPNRAPKELRGLVNELGFIAFSRLAKTNREVSRGMVFQAVSESVAEAIDYINRVSAGDDVGSANVDEVCLREAAHLSLRLLSFFPATSTLRVRPKFAGCGMLAACEGDVIVGDCLYEVKAGDRGFRVSDIRQLLVYSALAYARGELDFSRLGLFNPRTGLAWARSINDVCMAVSGQLANDVLSRLVENFSSSSMSR